ncbi:prepilin peptidase [Candidatus Micrarchaeota archaeon]|nr:prepilin peptidase [Candidatus Micrarchaeota archaeon]
MEFALLRFAICFVGCAAATYYDLFNRRNVPSWVTYSLVAIGALFTLASLNANVIVSSGVVALVIFVFGYILYRTGQIGGADVLVFISIALLLPEAPQSMLLQAKSQLDLPFVVSVFVLSGVLAIFGIFLNYIPLIILDFLRGEKVRIDAAQVALAAFTLVFYAAFLYYMNGMVELPQTQLAIFAAVIVCATSLFALKDHISEKYMIRMVGVNEIDEEDVLAIEKMDPKLVSEHKLDRLLTLGEIEKLKTLGKGKKFPVYKEMPVFMPYVLLALAAALLFGDPLAYLYPLSLLS